MSGLHEQRQLVRRALALLPPTERRRYRWGVILHMSTSALDLLGVLLIGLVGFISVTLVQGQSLPGGIDSLLQKIGLGGQPEPRVIIVLATSAAVLLTAKSILSLVISRKIITQLARSSAKTSIEMNRAFFSLPVTRVQEIPNQRTGFAMSRGINTVVVNVLYASMTIWSEITLLILIGISLVVIEPLVTLFALGFFASVVYLLNKLLAKWAREAGETLATTDVEAISTVYDTVDAYREITVADRVPFFTGRFGRLRTAGAHAYSDQQFIALAPRYAFEVALVFGAVLLVLLLLLTQPLEVAVASLTLFLAAASRMTPSLLRLHGARITLLSLKGACNITFEVTDFVKQHSSETLEHRLAASEPETRFGTGDAHPVGVSVRNLTVEYPGSEAPAILDVSFDVAPGQRIALVGSSGAGKSTLADAILGVVLPSSGEVLLDGTEPLALANKRPGIIAYMPQAVALISGTVRDNVALGIPEGEIDQNRVWSALRKANLADFLEDSRDGLGTLVGQDGVRLSGGQRQRIGVARALYSDPGLLVLDEATSALDAETEDLISRTVAGLANQVTVITIAHRLSTIKEADLVMYLEQGRVIASGNFEEVRKIVPQFDRQAHLLGL